MEISINSLYYEWDPLLLDTIFKVADANSYYSIGRILKLRNLKHLILVFW